MLLLEPEYCSIRPALALVVLIDGVVGRCRSVYAVLYRSTELPFNIYAVSDRRSCIGLGHVVSCCCISDSDVAAVMLQLCLLLMIAVTGYRVGRYK